MEGLCQGGSDLHLRQSSKLLGAPAGGLTFWLADLWGRGNQGIQRPRDRANLCILPYREPGYALSERQDSSWRMKAAPPWLPALGLPRASRSARAKEKKKKV